MRATRARGAERAVIFAFDIAAFQIFDFHYFDAGAAMLTRQRLPFDDASPPLMPAGHATPFHYFHYCFIDYAADDTPGFR